MIRGPLCEESMLMCSHADFRLGMLLHCRSLQPARRLHAGLFLAALVAAILMQIVMSRTPLGSVSRCWAKTRCGSLRRHKRAAATVLAMAVSGTLAGFAGAVEIAGLHQKLQDNFAAGFGLEAIAVALMARLHPSGNSFHGVSAAIRGVLHRLGRACSDRCQFRFPLVWIIEGDGDFWHSWPWSIHAHANRRETG